MFIRAIKKIKRSGHNFVKYEHDDERYIVIKIDIDDDSSSHYFAINTTTQASDLNGNRLLGGTAKLYTTYKIEEKTGEIKTEVISEKRKPKVYIAKYSKNGSSIDKNNMVLEVEALNQLIGSSYFISTLGSPCLIMPYIPGIDLEHANKYINSKKRKEFSFVNRLSLLTMLVTQLCEKLHFPKDPDHARFYHGDIKCENVMIMLNALTIQLIDPGFAKKMIKECDPRIAIKMDSVGGTLNYIAPEVLLYKKVALNSDQTGLCAVALVLLGVLNPAYDKEMCYYHYARLEHEYQRQQDDLKKLSKPSSIKEAQKQEEARAQWLRENSRNMRKDMASTPFIINMKELFTGYEIPESFDDELKSLLILMLNQLQDTNVKRRPSSRQFMQFCEILLKICTQEMDAAKKARYAQRLHDIFGNVRLGKEGDLPVQQHARFASPSPPPSPLSSPLSSSSPLSLSLSSSSPSPSSSSSPLSSPTITSEAEKIKPSIKP